MPTLDTCVAGVACQPGDLAHYNADCQLFDLTLAHAPSGALVERLTGMPFINVVCQPTRSFQPYALDSFLQLNYKNPSHS